MSLRNRALWVGLFALTVVLAAPVSAARADTGTVRIHGGAMTLARDGDRRWHPAARLDIAFRVTPPLQFGAYLEATANELPFDGPAFGGGLLMSLRPQTPLFGFLVPSVDASGGRTQLPNRQRDRIRAWQANLGAGLGIEVVNGVALEGRARHSWLFGYDDPEFDARAWTFTGGLALTLP